MSLAAERAEQQASAVLPEPGRLLASVTVGGEVGAGQRRRVLDGQAPGASAVHVVGVAKRRSARRRSGAWTMIELVLTLSRWIARALERIVGDVIAAGRRIDVDIFEAVIGGVALGVERLDRAGAEIVAIDAADLAGDAEIDLLRDEIEQARRRIDVDALKQALRVTEDRCRPLSPPLKLSAVDVCRPSRCRCGRGPTTCQISLLVTLVPIDVPGAAVRIEDRAGRARRNREGLGGRSGAHDEGAVVGDIERDLVGETAGAEIRKQRTASGWRAVAVMIID